MVIEPSHGPIVSWTPQQGIQTKQAGDRRVSGYANGKASSMFAGGSLTD